MVIPFTVKVGLGFSLISLFSKALLGVIFIGGLLGAFGVFFPNSGFLFRKEPSFIPFRGITFPHPQAGICGV